MDISKCFSESLGIRNNGSRLYFVYAQDELNLHILRVFEVIFSLDMAHILDTYQTMADLDLYCSQMPWK